MTSPRVVAVLLAGGTGTRVGHETPKQLLEVAGRPVIAHALGAFDRCDAVDE
ncbi:2-C-methyl-D-erythritol 4-phosphate cytidylyltransferase, partial [Aeromicrobium phragmitis]